MAMSNCLFSPTSENPRGFSFWCLLAKLKELIYTNLIAGTINDNSQKINLL